MLTPCAPRYLLVDLHTMEMLLFFFFLIFRNPHTLRLLQASSLKRRIYPCLQKPGGGEWVSPGSHSPVKGRPSFNMAPTLFPSTSDLFLHFISLSLLSLSPFPLSFSFFLSLSPCLTHSLSVCLSAYLTLNLSILLLISFAISPSPTKASFPYHLSNLRSFTASCIARKLTGL